MYLGGYTFTAAYFLDYIFNDPGHPSDQSRPGAGPGGQGRRGHSPTGGGFSGIKFDTSEVKHFLIHFLVFLKQLYLTAYFIAGWTAFGVIQSAFGNNLLNQNNLRPMDHYTNHMITF